MGEIVQIQVGQCGNQIGSCFWDKLIDEHKIDKDGKFIGNENEKSLLDYANVHLNCDPNQKYTPRSVFVDLDANVLENIKKSPLKNLFKLKNIVYRNAGTGNCWAVGHYTEGAEMVDSVLDLINKEVEACDKFIGFNFIYSTGGGTGSGLGNLIASKLAEEHKDKIFNSFNVVPSSNSKNCVLENYNTLMSLYRINQTSEGAYLFDNEALGKTCSKILKISNVKVNDMNDLISRSILGLTSCDRFSSQLNIDVRKLTNNLRLFPFMNFFVPNVSFKNDSLNELLDDINQIGENRLLSVNTKNRKLLCMASLFRGKNLSIKDIDEYAQNFKVNNSSYFVDFIPNSNLTGLCEVPEKNLKLSATTFTNTTAITEFFECISQRFSNLFKRRAFFHWYTGEGMDEMEFTEADSQLSDLIETYKQYENFQDDKIKS